MIISGTITNADQGTPLDRNSNTYQNIVIRDNNGREYTGRIGSKNGYAINTPIQVTYEMKMGNQGEYMYFHKYNPDWHQGGGQQQGSPQQQAPQQQQQQVPPQQQVPQQQQQAPQGPTDKDILIVRQCCVKAAANMLSAGGGDAEEAVSIARLFEGYCLGRSQAPPSQPSGPNPDYDPNYQQPEDSIPF